MDFIQNKIDRFDSFQRKHPFIGFPFAVIKKYGDDEAGKQAALLAYYGFLSLFPLLLVLTTTLKLFLQNDSAMQKQILTDATNYFPSIGNSLQPSQGVSGTGIALIIGIILTFFGARGVADIFRGAMNLVWQVPVVKRGGFPMALLKSISIIVVGGLGLLAAPIISGYAVSFGHNMLFKLIGLSITVLILFAVFLFLFKLALSEKRPIKELWLGSLVAAIGLAVLQSLGGLILTGHLKNLNSLYATFAIPLGLLFWLYLQTQLLLYAMEIDSVRVLKLSPRSVNQKALTPQDRTAFRLYAHRNRFHDEEEIDVRSKETKKRPLLERLKRLGEDSRD